MDDQLIAIAAALAIRDGRILLVLQQGPDDAAPGWMLPGGQLEPGETADAALRREVREETGLRVMGESPEAFRAASMDGDTCHLAVTFSCQVDGELLARDPDGRVIAAEWVPIDAALRRLSAVPWYDTNPLRRFLGY